MMLLVEAVMYDKDFTAMMFYKLYADLPSKVISVAVSYPKRFKCNSDESELVEPKRLADMVHVLTKMKPNQAGSRAFIRPAGTDDVLRIYAEAKTEGEIGPIVNEIEDEIKVRWLNYGEE